MVNTLFVGCSAVGRTFQVNRCEINDFFFRRYDFTRDHRSVLGRGGYRSQEEYE